MTKQEYHYACCLSSPNPQPADCHSKTVPAPETGQTTANQIFYSMWDFVVFCPVSSHGVSAKVAYAFGETAGMYLMHGYSIFKVRICFP
jgi:hypothetical protein